VLNRQLLSFLIIGLTTVLVDFSVYSLFLSMHLVSIACAKSIGFIVGTLFAYFANRAWTFSDTSRDLNSIYRFALLYCLTLCINIAVNAWVISVLSTVSWGVQFAFICATSVSACMNFIGMKWFVFNPNSNDDMRMA
jgi:putative flippase GtrA